MALNTTLERYDHIHRIAPEISARITASATAAHNEAEFERDVNNIIRDLAKDMGVQLLHREQYTLATGRADAVYNRFIIEYEPPGSLRDRLSHGHTAHAVQQVKDYIEGVAQAERHDRDRLLGVAYDGHYYIFVRYHEGHFITEEPIAHNAASTERFLRSLFSLTSGRALIPENLVDDFGNQNILAHQVTRALYNALEHHTDGLPAKLYEQWRLFFGETAGYDAAAGKLKHKKELTNFMRGMGLRSATVDVPRFFFAIHTYYSFLVKNVARLVLQAYAGGSLGTTPLTTIASLEGESLRRELEKMEDGGIFRTLGLKNLLEGDFFSWYLSAWDEEIEEALRQVLARLAEYNPVTVQDDPYSARDLLKKLYHYLLPREIRHDLGEFYTPDWLAERLLNQLQEPLFRMPGINDKPARPGKRLLDPACGSGTFLILAIRALKANCQLAGLAESETLDIILNSVAGIDLNPLAVMSSRVNILLAIADLLPYRRGEVEIPVYLADSILTPSRGKDLYTRQKRILETAVGPLAVPAAIDTRFEMEKLTDLLEEYVKGDFSTEAFLKRCARDLPDVAADPDTCLPILRELFEQLSDLHRRGLDGIWARVLKNAFMPMFLEPFDYVVGNPPWINWESLPPSYREQTTPLWNQYGLFVHSGMDTILGKGKKDVSTLMTYAVTDRFLKNRGKLGFVITQSVWKTAGAGQGFRRFRIGESGPDLSVQHVDDLSSVQAFEGASTRTSVFTLVKGQPTRYPVPYTYWQKTTRGRSLGYDSTLAEALEQTKRLKFSAAPVDTGDPTSAWLTARRRALDAVGKVLGPSEYQAHLGSNSGGANAVYCLEILAERPDGLFVARNVTEGAKRKVEGVTVELEPDLIYPLLRGRDVQRWSAQPSLHILMMQDPETRRGLDEQTVQQDYPRTWAYLKRFEEPLRERSGFKRYFTRTQGKRVIETGPFYSMFNVGDYTFAPWKVAWTRVGNDIQAGCFESQEVAGVAKPIIPLETATMVAFDNELEAHYFCAYVNSSLFRLAVKSYSVHGTGGFGSPHVLTNVAVPVFVEEDEDFIELASFSRRAHELALVAHDGDKSRKAELRRVEVEIDRAAAALWGLSDAELADVQASLRELKGEDMETSTYES